MSIVGVGIDVAEIDRFEETLERRPGWPNASSWSASCCCPA
jgi:phosphopantetheinyl transferase (holo-ACP synthase)